jgi:molecular chaperone HscB
MSEASARPETNNHFSTLGLPVDWALDEAELSARYLRAQKAVHPDRVAGASERERRAAERLAAQVNDAYRTLRSPLRRARHLLELSDAAPSDPGAEALAEQMNWHERLDAARGDAENLRALFTEVSAAWQRCEAGFEVAWRRRDMRAAADQCIRMQFIHQLDERIAACMPGGD